MVEISNASRATPDQRLPQSPLRDPGAVVRRGVEATDARVPGGVDGRLRVLVGDRREQAAERRAAEPEEWELQGDHMRDSTGMISLTEFETYDVRFPTSLDLDGSDAMNADPDYSAAYLILRTDAGDGLEGHGFAFTIGRGNDVQTGAIEALRDHVVGLDVDAVLGDLGGFWKSLVHDSQLRWLGPEKGVMHMAIGAVVNAVWDLAAKRAGVPLWKLLADLTPEQIVDLVDFRYLTDALTRDEALEILYAAVPGADRAREGAAGAGLPGVHDDARLARVRRREAGATLPRGGGRRVPPDQAQGRGDLDDDIRRMRLARAAVGPDIRIAIDANQRWDVADAIPWIEALAVRRVVGRGADEPGRHPRSRGDRPGDRSGAGCHRGACAQPGRVQAAAAGGIDVRADRFGAVAGVNENIAILLLAAKFGVPVCPHAGGVGCASWSSISRCLISSRSADRGEPGDRVRRPSARAFPGSGRGPPVRYLAPAAPGNSARMHPESVARYEFPHGAEWA